MPESSRSRDTSPPHPARRTVGFAPGSTPTGQRKTSAAPSTPPRQRPAKGLSVATGGSPTPDDHHDKRDDSPLPDDPASPADSTRSLRCYHPEAAAVTCGPAEMSRTLRNIGTAAVAYHAASWALKFILRRWGPAEFIKAPATRQHRAVLFMLSTFQCLITVIPFLKNVRSVWRTFGSIVPSGYATITARGQIRLMHRESEHLDDEPHLTGEDVRVNYRDACLLNEVMTGYLLNDLVSILPQAREYPGDIFHHLSGLLLCTLSRPAMKIGYVYWPVFFTAEFSTLFLNTMWGFREFPQTMQAIFPGTLADTIRENVLPLGFAATFAAIRGVMMPVMFYKMMMSTIRHEAHDPKTDSIVTLRTSNTLDEILGKPGRYSLFALQVLWWYWLALILKKVPKALGLASA